MKIATLRAVLLQEWRAAKKRIERDGVAQLTPPEEAGRMLEKYSGATLAYGMAEGDAVRSLLQDVDLEERGVKPRGGRSAS